MNNLILFVMATLLLIVATLIKTSLDISSPAFKNKQYIPTRYTCEGDDINPAITIKDIPKDAKSLVLIVDDPDAPAKTFDHWVMWNIPAKEITITENSAPGIQGKNSTGKTGYTGPCPPQGTHRYFFKVYALDIMLNLATSAEKRDVELAMEGHIVASGQLIGLYKKVNIQKNSPKK